MNKGSQLSQLTGSELTIRDKNFEVQKKLGEGGFAYVYLVRDVTGRPVDGAQMQNEFAPYCLKATSIQTDGEAKEIAEKEVSNCCVSERSERHFAMTRC